MRIPFAITSIAFILLHGPVNAGPPPACAQVSTLVDGAVDAPLANLAESQADAAQVRAQFRACLSSHNICGVVYNSRYRQAALVAGNVTDDLPAQYMSEQGKSSVIFLLRSIPRVRNDSNRYCLISERFSRASSLRQWDVYGWVIAANTGEPLPLQRQVLDYQPVSDPRSLRGLAAALWLFAQRMSGQSPL
jgi:hypothetical protein